MIKKLGISLLYFFSIIIISTIFITILNYFNILNNNIINILKLIIPITAIFISSFNLGKKSEKKGYIEGIKIGLIIIIIFSCISLLFKTFTPKSIIYYSILLLTSILSSMIGINKKSN